MRRSLVLAVLAALAVPATALAHASLEQTTPNFRQRLQAPPRFVTLAFDQGVTVLPNAVEVVDASGRRVSGTARVAHDPRFVRVPLAHVKRGAYTVRWHVTSGDGHVVSGVFTFGVRLKAPPPTQAYGSSGPTRSEHVVRWLYFLALALLGGGLGFRLLVAPGPLPRPARRRFFLITGLGAVAVLEVGIVAFLLRAEDALQLPFGRLLYGDLSAIAKGTRFGAAFIAMTLGYAFVTAVLFLAWLTERRVFLWLAFVPTLAFASGLSLSGHSAADAGASWKSELADWVHLSAALLWLGALVQLALVVWPLAPELRRAAFLRFSRLAPVLIALLLAAGVYLSILRLPHVGDLWTTGYGHVLLVKLALVAVALTWGGIHHFVVRPVLERRADAGLVGRVSRSLVGEGAVGMAVLLAAAVLVDSKPPPRRASPAAAAAASARR